MYFGNVGFIGCGNFVGSVKRLNNVYEYCDREVRDFVGGWGYGGGGFISGSN